MGLNLGLGIGLGFSQPRPTPSVADLLCQAIAAKRRVAATHKGKALTLSPHVTYRHNEGSKLLVEAVTDSVDGKAPNKPKLETYTVDDLTDVSVSADQFEPFSGFDPSGYGDHVRCIIQLV